MTQKRILHFTLGPVQGFITDARRTRDLWAGSFLLSWLSGQAMANLNAQEGKIIFPSVDDDALFLAIKSGTTEKYPHIGSLPNRFKADVTDVVGDPAKICQKAINDAWRKLAQAVWEQFIAPATKENCKQGTKAIWDQQVNSFWQMNWVLGEEPSNGSDADWLACRKNWRDPFSVSEGIPTEEGGELCSLMGFYQEISGFSRLSTKTNQKEFYDNLREQKYDHPNGRRKLGELNIGLSERLCSLALIKRLFPLLDNIENVIGWNPGGNEVNIINWPSVSYIAAVPWLKQTEKLSIKKRTVYDKAIADALTKSFRGETDTKLFGLPDEDFFTLDGHLLHKDGIQTWPIEGLSGKDEQNRINLLEAYSTLTSELKSTRPEPTKAYPSEFYALLLMDGDRIGEKVREHGPEVKSGLACFTESVKAYFSPNEGSKNPNNGALIYAGGDDVLAVLPLDGALPTARCIRERYREAFKKATEGKSTLTEQDFTLSGAIVFAQYKIPLRAVLEKAHHYLDKIAKDQNGRDSLAIAVMKPGGISFDWVSCWEGDQIETMETIARDRSDYSTSFFYNIRERYKPLFEPLRNEKNENAAKPKRDIDPAFSGLSIVENILAAEYKKQPQKSKLSIEDAKTKIAPLLKIGHPLKRDENKSAAPIDDYSFDAALVARFLSEEGRWDKPAKSENDAEGKANA